MADTKEKFILEFATRGVESIDSAQQKIGGLTDRVNTLATALLGVGFLSFIKGAMESADRISDFSDATNISISSIKAFGAALDESGGKAKNTERIINSFYAAIENANNGSIKTRDAFAAVGVSFQDLGRLSETELFYKTIRALAEMPPGAERAALATELLSKAFRGVDPKAFEQALDPEKFLASEEATKLAAKRLQEMEEAYRILGEGALKAMEPILKMMGEHKLTVETATRVVQILGIALGAAFGANLLLNIIQINKALLSTAAIGNLLGKNPVVRGLAIAGLAAVEGTAAYLAFEQATKSLSDEQDKLAQSAGRASSALPDTGAGAGRGSVGVRRGGLTSATPESGAAGRKQELDARQRAVLESARRTAQSVADAEKEIAYRGASDLERINIEAEANIKKAREEIYSKENLSKTQKAQEFAAKKKEIETKAETDRIKATADAESTLYQQKAGYMASNAALLGFEATETQKVTDLIKEQPAKYKEIGDRLLENAKLQDENVRFIKKFKEEQDAAKKSLEDFRSLWGMVIDDENKASTEQKKRFELTKATTDLERKQIEIKFGEQEKYYQRVAALDAQYKKELDQQAIAPEDVSAEQSARLVEYYGLLGALGKRRDEQTARLQQQAEWDAEYQRSWVAGWRDAFNQYADNAANSSKEASTYFNTYTKGMEDALYQFVTKGKLDFTDLANSIIADMIKIQIRKAIVGMTSFFGFAAGGEVMAGQPIIVGERGPELFMPKGAGKIIPNNQLDGGAGGGAAAQQTVVNYNIQAVDASSFRSLVARDPSFIFAVTEQGRRSQPSRRLG
jgi:lambda family phage tail tape measure protein